MKKIFCIAFVFVAFILTISCETANNATPAVDTPLTPAQVLITNLDSLKGNLQQGDLILRLGDDFISDRIRFLSEKDPSYSHAGIVVNRNGQTMVCHIYPEDDKQADTVKYQAVTHLKSKKEYPVRVVPV